MAIELIDEIEEVAGKLLVKRTNLGYIIQRRGEEHCVHISRIEAEEMVHLLAEEFSIKIYKRGYTLGPRKEDKSPTEEIKSPRIDVKSPMHKGMKTNGKYA